MYGSKMKKKFILVQKGSRAVRAFESPGIFLGLLLLLVAQVKQ